jgi:hypothetical protein
LCAAVKLPTPSEAPLITYNRNMHRSNMETYR